MSAGDLTWPWRTTRLVAAARWRTVRTTSSRAWLWVALAAGSLGLSLAAQAGDLVRLAAETEGDTSAVGVVANTYIRQWARNGFGSMTSVILAFVLGSSVVIPLMSSSAPALMPGHHLVGVRTPSMTSYTGALAAHLTSLATFVQLLALTALAGMLTIDGVDRARAVGLVWVAWAVLVLCSQCALWGARAVRLASRRMVGACCVLVAGGLGVAVSVGSGGFSGLFGASAAFTWWLLSAPLWVSLACTVAAGGVAGVAGWVWCAQVVRAGSDVTVDAGADRRARAMPADPTRALAALVARSFTRTRSIYRPLAMITVLAAAGAALAGDRPATAWSVGIGVPVAVALAFTDNAAAMTGPANSWISSLPGQGARLLAVWGVWAWACSVVLVALAWAPGVLLGHAGAATSVIALATGVAASSTITAASLWHAVRRPSPARTGLGDPMLSATATIGATLRLLAVPAVIAWVGVSGGWTMLGLAPTAPLQVLGAGACVAVSLLASCATGHRWSNPRTRALCLAGAS